MTHAEFWTSMPAIPGRAVDAGTIAEAAGWDGLGTVDSQNLSGDPYVFLALAATGSSRLGVATSVTNSVTRHPAVTATSAMTVQRVSGGRMVLGIGRGDSALAYLGRAPARVAAFERYLAQLQCYLRGEEVPFADLAMDDALAPPVETLALADAPDASAIHWPRDLPKVPVEVAATGPKVIALAARHAERVMFALGADPERLAWGVELARSAAEEAGRDPAALQFGAYVNVACHADLNVARELARAGTSLFARFSAMHGTVSGPAAGGQEAVFLGVRERYDMNKHAQRGGAQTQVLDDAFMDRYAIVGGADHCTTRFEQLLELGIDRFSVSGPNFLARGGVDREAAEQLTRDVLPRLRG
jgi:5,10-methylenetetrahydromethanopterin reductase